MSDKLITLFADTNLFIQCRALAELPWASLGDFDEVRLIVCRPVQKEIDRNKQGGNARLSRRAREASGVLRQIVSNNLNPVIVRETAPRVTLSLRIDLKPNPELAATLNYDEHDDTLVGIAHAFGQTAVGQDVAVLTGDTGVMASAVAVQIKHIAISDGWHLPPEASKEEKELKEAQAELRRLRRSEPAFAVKNVDSNGHAVTAFVLEHKIVHALTSNEIASLMEHASRRFPMVADFGKAIGPSLTPTGRVRLESLKGVHMPPDAKQIEDYHHAYRLWEKELKDALTTVHQYVRAQVSLMSFSFEAQNTGTRPATDVLVEMNANGPFLLRRPERDRDAGRHKPVKPVLPSPPSLPKRRFFTSDLLKSFGNYGVPGFRPELMRGMDVSLIHQPSHDPEAFMYKERSGLPAETLSLECDLWRHGRTTEEFSGEIELDEDCDCRGSIRFEIHASNLSDAVSVTVPVNISTVGYPTVDHVRRMVDELKEAEA